MPSKINFEKIYIYIYRERERERERETSIGVALSEGNQCMRTPRLITAGISLNRRGVVTCTQTFTRVN